MAFKVFRKKRRPRNEAVIDLGKLNKLEEQQRLLREATVATATNTNHTNSTDTSFLSALAGAAATSETGDVLPVASSQNLDAERLERLGRRINSLIDKFELLERKITRIERRVDLKY